MITQIKPMGLSAKAAGNSHASRPGKQASSKKLLLAPRTGNTIKLFGKPLKLAVPSRDGNISVARLIASGTVKTSEMTPRPPWLRMRNGQSAAKS
jgi:hypothetical protein